MYYISAFLAMDSVRPVNCTQIANIRASYPPISLLRFKKTALKNYFSVLKKFNRFIQLTYCAKHLRKQIKVISKIPNKLNSFVAE